MRIILKLNENIPLSDNEAIYIKKWINILKKNPDEEFLVKHFSRMKMANLTTIDLMSLNYIPFTNFTREYDEYSISDLFVELNWFLDSKAIEEFEYLIRQNLKIKQGKAIYKTSLESMKIKRILEKRNEEILWRKGGMLTEENVNSLVKILSLKRNKDSFDKPYFKNDVESIKSFIQSINLFDDRIHLLEKWIIQQESQMVNRHTLFSQERIEESDPSFLEEIKIRLRERGTKIIEKFFNKDFHKINQEEIHHFVCRLVEEMTPFSLSYTIDLKSLIESLLIHPNILPQDSNMLEIFEYFYDLNWENSDIIEDYKKEYQKLSLTKLSENKSQKNITDMIEEISKVDLFKMNKLASSVVGLYLS